MAAGIQLPDNGETIDLQQQVARLQALLEASRQVHSTIREEEVLEQVLRIVVRELEMAGASFSRGLGWLTATLRARTTSARWTRWLIRWKTAPASSWRSWWWPSPGGRALTIYETDFIEGLALQAAVALENARNHKRNVEFARVQQDMDAARAIQRSLLPQRLPIIPGYSLAFRSDTCYEVGGDYLDIVPSGRQPADGGGRCSRQGNGFGDYVHHFRSAFRAMAADGSPLDELAARMNQHHWAEGEEARRRYVTAIFLRLHAQAGEIEVVNAGHNPGFWRSPARSRASLRPRARRWECCRGCATRASAAIFCRERACCFIPTG